MKTLYSKALMMKLKIYISKSTGILYLPQARKPETVSYRFSRTTLHSGLSSNAVTIWMGRGMTSS